MFYSNQIIFSIIIENKETLLSLLSLKIETEWKYKYMNLTILSYIIYLSISFFITIYVGLFFYRNGRIYLESIFQNETQLVDPINKMLLVGYYLVNLGFIALNILTWESINSLLKMINAISWNIGMICIILGILHFINMAVTALIAYKRNYSSPYKTI